MVSRGKSLLIEVSLSFNFFELFLIFVLSLWLRNQHAILLGFPGLLLLPFLFGALFLLQCFQQSLVCL